MNSVLAIQELFTEKIKMEHSLLKLLKNAENMAFL